MPEPKNNTINYIELPMSDKDATTAFYSTVFGWEFVDYGPEYMSFSGANVDGGFNAFQNAAENGNGVLVVLYADDLEATCGRVQAAGSEISKEIFSFPGGRRFHFIDPNGNELAVWGQPVNEEGSNDGS